MSDPSPSPRAIFKLKNQVKHYDWGSPKWIPQLLGVNNADGEPWAELWMGVHPGAPSLVSSGGGEITLGSLIAEDPRQYLGRDAREQFGSLPFLFKLLAAAKPLSIQAHPSWEQARRGWQRENERHIPSDAPNRNYKDDNHKPEIICALSPFTAMCGFREPREIAALMEIFFGKAPRPLQDGLRGLKTAQAGYTAGAAPPAMQDGLRDLKAALAGHTVSTEPDAEKALKSFLKALFSLSAETRQELTGYILKTAAGAKAADKAGPSKEFEAEWEIMARFAELYPGDPGIIAPLYLNLLHLAPGDAVYLDAGVLHAYIDGFGVELMANSDNVLRGGLTAKHVDVDELMEVLDFHPLKPEILKPQFVNPAPDGPASAAKNGFSRYITPCREFSLVVMRGKGGKQAFPGGPAIIIVTEGSVKISAAPDQAPAESPAPREKEELVLNRGESAFISAGQAPLAWSFEGDYTLYAAALP
ncbi:mannose-6-phosphate isomerase, class I [Spirochaetia bacterium]|nr:mannose-6-phosphate isomerase, class I [Spirochaetia bacterium]